MSSDLHTGAVVWVTAHTIINFKVAGPEQDLDQGRWQMGEGLGHAWALRLSGLTAEAAPGLDCGS